MYYQSIQTGAVCDVIHMNHILHRLTNSSHSNHALGLVYSCIVMSREHNVLKGGILTEVVDFTDLYILVMRENI